MFSVFHSKNGSFDPERTKYGKRLTDAACIRILEELKVLVCSADFPDYKAGVLQITEAITEDDLEDYNTCKPRRKSVSKMSIDLLIGGIASSFFIVGFLIYLGSRSFPELFNPEIGVCLFLLGMALSLAQLGQCLFFLFSWIRQFLTEI